jgi:hypothetical protein
MVTAVVECRSLPDFKLWVKFADGQEGVADLSFLRKDAQGDPLLDPDGFAKATVNPTSRSVVWPGGIDIDPAKLRHLATAQGQQAAPAPVSVQRPAMPRVVRSALIVLGLLILLIVVLSPGLRWITIATGVCVAFVLEIIRRTNAGRPGVCGRCGYSLEGVAPTKFGDVQCPECGRFSTPPA